MFIEVERKTGWFGAFPNFRIIINGVKGQRIQNGETILLDIPDDGADLQVTQQGVKSNHLTVDAGDQIEIYTTAWGTYFLPAMILFNLVASLMHTFFTLKIYLLFLSLFLILTFFIFFFIDGKIFRIRKTS
jgi:hypothetical protein